jgi:hypothetical protein
VAAVTLAVAVGGTAAAWPASAAPRAAPAAARAAGPGHGLVPLRLPARAVIKPDARPMAVSGTCGTVRAHLRQYAARHIRRVTCVTAGLAAAPAPARGTGRPGATTAPVIPLCYNTSHVWEVNRTQECIQNATITDTVIDTSNGDTTGEAFFSVNQSITLGTNNNSIVENDNYTETSAWGTADVPAPMELTATCGAGCRPETGGAQTYPTKVGTTQNITVYFVDTPATGLQENFTTRYTAYLNVPGTVFISNAAWSTPNTIRCDNQLTGRGVGCVFPGYTPTLTLSVATYGAAAVNVWIGENVLAGTPGLIGTPLTRGDPSLTQGNRSAICDSTFIRLNMLVPFDSCDEYPFASSQQSGGTQNLIGLNCLEAMPTFMYGKWYVVPFAQYTIGSLKCERGHVTVALNTALGSQALGPLYTLNRMLPGDPYVVVVTS